MTAGRSDRWVKLYAKALDSALLTEMSPVAYKVFSIFLLMANPKDKKWWDGKQYVLIPRGSLVISTRSLAERFDLTRQQIRTAMDQLIHARITTQRSTHNYTIVTVLKYNTYQGGSDMDQPKDQPSKQPSINPASTQPLDTVEPVEVDQYESADALSCSTAQPPSSAKRIKRAPSASGPTPEQLAWFGEFWELYWRRVGRKKALAKFTVTVTTPERHAEVIQALKAQTPAMSRKDPEFIPHPATWLNQERWDDEIPTAVAVAVNGHPTTPQTFAERNERLRNEKFTTRFLRDLEASRGTNQPK